MRKQVNKNEYSFLNYSTPGRWSSYWYQVKEVLSLAPRSILEIGAGDKVLGSYLKNNTEIKYKNLDVAEDLEPDFIGSVDAMPFADDEFEVVCAFEVLEHLPYEQFEKSLGEMKRVAGKHVIISLPHWGRHFSFELRMPFVKCLRWQHKFNLWPIKHVFKGQHYWEIGKREYPLNRIKKGIINAGLDIVDDYIVFEMPYHHFFVLKK